MTISIFVRYSNQNRKISPKNKTSNNVKETILIYLFLVLLVILIKRAKFRRKTNYRLRVLTLPPLEFKKVYPS